MNNFEKHYAIQALEDQYSRHALAKMVIEVRERIAVLERENAWHKESLKTVDHQYGELKTERDALAAHVEQLKQAGQALRLELAQWSLTERDPETSAAMCEFDHVSRKSPVTSLDSIRAEAAADHIGLWADTILQAITDAEKKHLEDSNFFAISFDMIAELTTDMKEDAKRIRQQAEVIDPREMDPSGHVADQEAYE